MRCVRIFYTHRIYSNKKKKKKIEKIEISIPYNIGWTWPTSSVWVLVLLVHLYNTTACFDRSICYGSFVTRKNFKYFFFFFRKERFSQSSSLFTGLIHFQCQLARKNCQCLIQIGRQYLHFATRRLSSQIWAGGPMSKWIEAQIDRWIINRRTCSDGFWICTGQLYPKLFQVLEKFEENEYTLTVRWSAWKKISYDPI